MSCTCNIFIRFAFVPLVSAGLILTGCRPDKPEPKSAPAAASPASKVKVAEVEERTFADEIEALGTIRAQEAIELSATVTERVMEVRFEDGDRVKHGDLLVRLQDAEEVAAMAGAQAELAEQEREIKRLKGLVAEGAVSEVRLQEYHTRREIAEQRVAEARAKIADRRIEAPFDGVLGFRRVSVGALVSPGDLIATLDVLDPVKLDFTVPETFLEDLQLKQKITALSEAFPNREFVGTVTQIDTRVNAMTRSITVRAEIPNPGHPLRPGMLMTTTLRKNVARSLAVPERALVSVQSDHFVYVKPPDQEVVRRTPVKIGRRVPGFVEIREGVESGQTVVSDGLVGLADGATVKVVGRFAGPAAAYQPAPLAH